jgi:hypothetical protein
MKNLKGSHGQHVLRTLLYLFAMVFVAQSSYGQTPISPTSNSDARSPSITAFRGTAKLALAYVSYSSGNKIHVTTSTDDGVTWASPGVTLPIPSGMDNMDDPQILADDNGNNVTLVARGYLESTAEGQRYDWSVSPPGATGVGQTLFKTSGIYFIHSSNAGSTWPTSWTAVATETSGSKVTLDHPRIAIRRDYGGWVNTVPGCIIWERRTWTLVPDSHGANTFPSSGIATKLGMRFYLNGSLLNVHGTGDAYTSIGTNTIPNAMRPSVAISPDGGIWIGYYCISNWSTSKADYYAQKGHVVLTASGTTYETTLTFSSTNSFKITGTTPPTLPGFYDQYRGYFFSEEGQLHHEFDAELAQGPSIQVAVSNIYQCQPTYKVGIVYSRNDNVVNNPYVDAAATDVNRWITLWLATVPFDEEPQNVAWHPQDQLDYTTTSDWYMGLLPVLKYSLLEDDSHSSHSPAGKAANGAVEAPKVMGGGLPQDPREASFFVLSYLYAIRCAGANMLGNTLDWMSCRTGFSFDNNSFVFVDAEPQCHSVATITDLVDFGTKIDVSGERGDMEVHTAWHHIHVGSLCSPDQLFVNNGGAIVAKRYLDAYPLNDPNAFPTGSSIYDLTIGSTVSADDPYQYFNYNGINQPTDIKVKTSANPLTTASTVEGIGLGSFQNGTSGAGNLGHDFTPQLATDINTGLVNYGEYWAHYIGTTKTDYGDLNFSDQRKLVITGGVAHAVFEKDGKVFYSQGMSAINGSQIDRKWTQPVPIDASTSNSQTYPSIAVYEEASLDTVKLELSNVNYKGAAADLDQNGGLDGFSGKTSIAVTWTEYSGTLPTLFASVKMRIKEFNVCTGQWADWSPVRTVYTSAFAHDITNHDLLNVPVSMASPLIAAQSSLGQYRRFINTDLIGWISTWTDEDQLIPPNATEYVESRCLLRPNTTNSDWGTYTSTQVPSTGFNTLQNIITLGAGPGGTTLDNFLYFLSSTSAENKRDYAYDNPNNYRIDFGFSTNGNSLNNGVLAQSAIYVTSAGTALGSLVSASIPVFFVSPHLAHSWTKDRNPCITVNSSGQKFMAWEAMCRICSFPKPYQSQIKVANSFVDGDWTKKGLKNVLTLIVEDALDASWTWLRNPSIAGVPKTRLYNADATGGLFDNDLGQVQLLYWLQRDPSGASVHTLYSQIYSEEPYQPGVASGTGWNRLFTDLTSGTNAQVSFSTFGENVASPLVAYPALMLGNSPVTPNAFSATVSPGTYKLGVFDSVQPYALYRSEEHVKDSSFEKFIWGDVYVSNGSGPADQVKLSFGIDTSGYDSHTAIRDSIFRTARFVLPTGSNITYFRGVEYPSCDSQMSSLLQDTNLRVNYTIELVRASGQIDTIEQLCFSPGNSSYIVPSTIHTQGSLTNQDTVFLRVRGSVSGYSDADSNCVFANEMYLGYYSALVDSTLGGAPKAAQFRVKPNELAILNPYPNPLHAGDRDMTALISIPKGARANLRIVDATGRYVGELGPFEGRGTWSVYKVAPPKTAGSYFLEVTDGSAIKVVPFTVVK